MKILLRDTPYSISNNVGKITSSQKNAHQLKLNYTALNLMNALGEGWTLQWTVTVYNNVFTDRDIDIPKMMQAVV